MLTDEGFIDECENLFNDIVVYGDDSIYRLIGCHLGEDDYYYTLKTLHGEIHQASAVGAIISLKGIYPRYEEMDNLFSINVCPKELNFKPTRDAEELECMNCHGKGKVKRYY